MFFRCPSVCLSKYLTGHLLLNYWINLLKIFRNYFLGSLYLHALPLSVCLLKYLSGHFLLNYWMDLLQIFRNYFLGSLYLHVLPLSVCLSVKILDRTYPPKVLHGFTSNFQELLLKIPIFASSSVVRLSVCQNT